MGDRTDSALEGLEALRESIGVSTRVRMDAARYTPAPPRQPKHKGRPRQKGRRRPTLAQRVADPTARWPMVNVAPGYGQAARGLHITSATAVWYHAGMPSVPLRWALIRDPAGQLAPQAWRSTTLALDPRQILPWCVHRWTLATPVEEARAHLGLEPSRQWKGQSIRRTPPVVLGRYSSITLAAAPLIEGQPAPVQMTAW